MRSTYVAASAALALATLAASCASDTSATDGSTSDVSGTVTVFAAASLTAAFTEIGDAFHTAHPSATVEFSFDASSTLVTQLKEGAPADVFASADEANMIKLVDAGGNDGGPEVFAKNSLQIIVEKGNPKGITAVADLARSDLIYVTCAPEVPIGKYAAQVLKNAGASVTPASLEANVKGIVTKVTAGEADAGIVYTTDVTAAGAAAQGIDIPADINVTASYPLVVTKQARNPSTAREFVDFVVSQEGQRILANYGFSAP